MAAYIEIDGSDFIALMKVDHEFERREVLVDHDQDPTEFELVSVRGGILELRQGCTVHRIPAPRCRQFIFRISEESKKLIGHFRDKIETKKFASEQYRVLASFGILLKPDAPINQIALMLHGLKSVAMPPHHERQSFFAATKYLSEHFTNSSDTIYRASASLIEKWIDGREQPFASDFHINGAFFNRHIRNTKRALDFSEIASCPNTRVFDNLVLAILRTERAAALLDQIEYENAPRCEEAHAMLRRSYGALSSVRDTRVESGIFIEDAYLHTNNTKCRFERVCRPYK